MIARPRQSTRTDTLFPYTTLIRSFQLPDGRIFFAIPYERDFTLIGTTDADHEGPLDAIHASAEEIEYLCEGANQYFRTAINPARSEEHTSEPQSLMRISYAVLCLKKKYNILL